MLARLELMLMTLAPTSELPALFVRSGRNVFVIDITPQTLVFMIWSHFSLWLLSK
jgi:hypothetical protein